MSHVATAVSWFKQNFSWSNSAQSWIERILAVGFVVSFASLCWQTGERGLWSLPYWLGFFIFWAVVGRLTGFKIFGPVLFYDMLTTARRGRYSLIRVAYSGLLLLVLFWVWAMEWGGGFRHLTEREAAGRIAMTFFNSFTVVQLIGVFLLTPAYVAG